MLTEKLRKLELWIFIFFACVFIFISNGRFGGDGLENYLTAESIVLDKDLSIHDRPFQVKEMHYEDRGPVGKDGKIYSSYGLAMALMLVPFYFFGHILSNFLPFVPHDYITQFAVSMANPLVLALLSVVLFRLLLHLGYNLRASFIAVVVYSLCTMNLIYARSGFSEPLVAILVLIAVLELFIFSKNNKPEALCLAGLAFGYALFIKKNSFILFPGFLFYFIYLLLKVPRKGARNLILIYCLAFFVPIALSFLAIMIQNKVMYGGITNTEFGAASGLFQVIWRKGLFAKGIYHYLLSSGKGYFFYNLPMLLGLFAVKDFFKKNKSFCVFIILLLLLNLIYYSVTFTRDTLFSWGPRYLFPTLPLMAVFLAEFINKKNTVQRRSTIIFAALAGFLIQLPSLIISFSKYLFFVKEKLLLSEYLLNYMPELSPIRGAWGLFLSFLHRHLFGSSLNYYFNPDFRFVIPKAASLFGYDGIDIWWVNILKVNPSLVLFPVILAIFFLVAAVLSLSRIISFIKKQTYAS